MGWGGGDQNKTRWLSGKGAYHQDTEPEFNSRNLTSTVTMAYMQVTPPHTHTHMEVNDKEMT